MVKANRPKPISTDSKKNAMNTNHQNQINDRLQNQPDQFSTGSNGTRSHSSVYDRITERVMDLLNQGTVPWHKPWNVKRGFPRNLVSGKAYRGINVFLLHSMHYESPFWLTFKQAQELGANVRKGEKACSVVFWKQLEVENKETREIEKVPMARIYSLFNVAQIDGLKELPDPAASVAITKPDEIIANMPQRPEMKFGFAKAFYSPAGDFVGLPDRQRFTSADEFHSVCFHEHVHASGAAHRLNRPGITEGDGFGSEEYSKEELIAEMGAAFLCGVSGIAERTLNNSAAFIQNWLEALKNDHKLIVQAAAQAQKAADFILGTKFEEAPAEN